MAAPNGVSLRFDAQKLLISAAVVAPFLLADMILVLDRARDAQLGAVEGYLETLARSAAAGVEEFIDAGTADAAALAARAAVAEAVAAGDTRSELELTTIDGIWQTPAAEGHVRQIVSGPLAGELRSFVDAKPFVLRALITNRRGVVVAASHKPDLYYHGDQNWWTQTIGAGRTQVGGAVWDPISRHTTVPISAPVLPADQQTPMGAVRLFLTLEGVSPFLEEALPGATGQSLLVASDGRLIDSGRGGRSFEQDVEEMRAVSGAIARRASGAVRTERGGIPVLVGYVETGLRRAYPDLDWSVLVVQDQQEASAPIRPVFWRTLAGAMLVVLLLAALGVYVASHRRRKLDPLEQL